MATVTAFNTTTGFNMTTLGLKDFFVNTGTLTYDTGMVSNVLPSGETVTAFGELQYSASGQITGGTIGAIEITGTEGTIMTVAGLDAPADVIASWILSSETNLRSWEYPLHGHDNFDGSEAGDYLMGFLGDDTIYARGGDDTVIGGEGANVIYGNLGNDSLVANGTGGFSPEDQIVFGGQGNDTVVGFAFDDALYGNLQDDLIDAGDGRDALYGGQGNDTMNGGYGDDTLFGNKGDDLMDGGDGFNTYVLGGEFGNDRIIGYVAAEDHIEARGGITLVSIVEADGNTVINFSTGTVTLVGVNSVGVEASISLLG